MPKFRSEDQYPNWCELEHFHGLAEPQAERV